MITKDYIECKPIMLPWSGEMPESYEDFKLLAKDNPMHSWGPSDPHIQLGTVWLTNQLLMNKMGYIPQQLYLISDEGVKEGDWYMCSTRLFRAGKNPIQIGRRKIVAATDKSLGLPLIPESFIKLYVEKQGKIDKVRVVVDTFNGFPQAGMFNPNFGKVGTKNGEVIILPIVDKMYSRDEVFEILVERDLYKLEVEEGKVPLSEWLGILEWFDKTYPI